MSKLKWRDSEDSYKPINRPLWDFLQANEDRLSRAGRSIDSLHSTLISHEMSVFVVQKAEDQLKEHLSLDPNNETGGVLVGEAYFCKETRTYYTEILGSIPALHTVGNRVHFKFTPDCWQEILKIQNQDFPEATVVGWYHSHPGHGIFLSGTDLNTQRLSFKQIWQIATVYDPLRHEIGFFYGADGEKISPIYIQNLPQYSSRKPEPQLPIIPQSAALEVNPTEPSVEQLEDNRTEPNVERLSLSGSQPLAHAESQPVAADVVEENVLSAIDTIHQVFKAFVKVIFGLFKR
jgi:26S proteasome regulatory subunit N11